MEHITGCILCGKPIIYIEESTEKKCENCGKIYKTNAYCEGGHYICDNCHSSPSYAVIKEYCLNSKSISPIDMAIDLMKRPEIHMHGPEHHFLIPAVMLTSLKNSGSNLNLKKSLEIANNRARNVLGGFCGFYGACGAAFGTGIFVSIVKEATPYSIGQDWAEAQFMTSESLNKIATLGGPRCCKRSIFTAIEAATRYSNKNMGTNIPLQAKPTCNFSLKNKECKHEECIYFPAKV